MKKTLKLLAAVTLIALTTAACQKEQLSDNSAEGTESVTFTVQTEVGTKAVADEDGLAAKIDQVLVAVYMKDGDTFRLYDEPVATYTASNKQATFSVNLIRKQTYQIVVWAQKEGAYDCTDGLQSIVRSSEKASVCNDDELDAFYASHEYVQGSPSASTSIQAKRPFAQLNLITKDLRTDFEPSNVTVTYVSDTKFNALTGLSSEPAATAVTYTSTQPNYKAQGKTLNAAKNTLAMNYLFAPETEQIILPSVKMTAKLTEVVDFEVSNVPAKRNYRTNVIGNLLTEQTNYTITVVPTWEGETEVSIPTTYAAAQAAVADPKIQTVVVTQEVVDDYLAKVESGAINPGSQTLPDGSTKKLIEFKLTQTSPTDLKQFELPAAPDGYAWHITHEDGYPTQNVDVVAPAASSVIIDAPNSHVTLNGQNYSAVIASTSGTTLVVPEGIVIDKLEILKGGLEIHGTVNVLKIAEDADVVIRDCEGLSQAVYDVAKPYIAATYYVVKDADKYDIRPIQGSGSQADPYIIDTPDQFLRIQKIDSDNKVANGINPNTRVYFKLTSDIILGSDIIPEDKVYNTLFKYLYSVELDGKKADGGSYKVTLPDSCALVTYPYYMNLKNLDFQMYETTLVWWQVGTCLFENVDLYGSMSVSGNTGAYEIYNQATYTTFKDCTSYMTLTGIGGYRDYNSVFVGYKFGSTSNLTFENCSNKGSLVCGKASMFLGNPNSNTIVMNVNNCRNEGTLIATYTAPDYNFNYYFSTSSNNYSFTLNGTEWTHNNSLPTSYMASAFEDQLIINTGVIQNGPAETGMKLTLNSNGTFAIAAATDNTIGETPVANYEVSLGLYVGIENGSNRFFASEKIAANGSASYTSTIKNYQFVDKIFVGEGVITTDAAGNRIFVDGNTTYYVVEDNETVRSAPRSATMFNLSAFDAQGKLLASVTLTEDVSPAPAMFSKMSARKSAAIKVEAPTRVVELTAKNIVVE